MKSCRVPFALTKDQMRVDLCMYATLHDDTVDQLALVILRVETNLLVSCPSIGVALERFGRFGSGVSLVVIFVA